MQDFRPAGATLDRLFVATARHQFLVLGFDDATGCVVTHARCPHRPAVAGTP